MRVFLTGASGFIGSQVLRRLLACGHEATALVMPGDPLWRLRDLADRFSVLEGTLIDIPALRPRLAAWKPDACIHLAWYAEPGKYLHAPENISALTSTLTLVKEMAEVGCMQMVGCGTCAEYDTDLGYLREDGATRPATLYAAAKLACCIVGQPLAAAAKMGFAWGRVFYPYGPYEDERRAVPALIRALLQEKPFPVTLGEQVRDYVHVEDVASALVMLAERNAIGVFNIASGIPVTIRQLMETVGEILDRSHLIQFGVLPYREWEPKFICGDSQRLRELGWVQRYNLRSGLQQTVDWWRTASERSREKETVEESPEERW